MKESFFEIETKFQELYFTDSPSFFSKNRIRAFYYLVNNQLNFDSNELDGDGRSILTEISSVGDLFAVKWLVSAGANPNHVGRHFNFSLANAAESGWKEVYDYLRPISNIYITNLDLDAIAECNFRSNQQISMRICEFIHNQDFTSVRRTIRTNLHCVSEVNGVRILSKAVTQKNISMVKLLLEFGAETTHEYGIIPSDETPMSIACSQGNLETVKLLIKSGGRVNTFYKKIKCWTPLMSNY
jgi:ankyrin repeat protein